MIFQPLRGVSKSGSPRDRLITFFPSAIIFRATVEMKMVTLGWMQSSRSAVRVHDGFPATRHGTPVKRDRAGNRGEGGSGVQ